MLGSHLLIILSTLLILGVFLNWFVGNYLYQQQQQLVERQGREVALLVSGALSLPTGSVGLISLMDTFDRLLAAHVWLADVDGRITITSPRERAQRGNLLPADEMRRVLAGETITRVAHSRLLRANVMTVMTPVIWAGEPVGAVVVNVPLTGMATTLAGIRQRLALAGVLAIVLSALVGYTLSRRIAGPVQAVTRAAQALGQGDYSIRVPERGEDELANLGRAFNELAQRLGRTVAALGRAESQTRALLASVAEGVVGVDREGKVLVVNRPAQRLLGWERLPEWLSWRASTTEGVEAVLSGCLHEALATRQEVRRLADGPQVAIVATPVQGVGDEPAGAVALLRDISSEVRQEQFRREFLATVSHELKTPLTSIRGFLQALYDGVVSDTEQARHYYRLMLEETLRLTRLVNSLLDLSRIESGVVRLTPSAVEVAGLIQQCVDQMLPASDEKEITVVTEIPSGLPPVWADWDRAKQVLINLLDNAIRHTPSQGKIWVTAVELADGSAPSGGRGAVRISVRDTGPGIPADEQARVWERFYKVDKSRQRDGGGNGLGLYIVKELVQLHGGEVGLRSGRGEGAEFWFSLPTSPPPERDRAERQLRATAPIPPPDPA